MLTRTAHLNKGDVLLYMDVPCNADPILCNLVKTVRDICPPFAVILKAVGSENAEKLRDSRTGSCSVMKREHD